MIKNTIVLSVDKHKQQDVVTICFDFDRKIIELLKRQFAARWSKSAKYWWVARRDFDLHQFFQCMKDCAFIDYSKLISKAKHKAGRTETTKRKVRNISIKHDLGREKRAKLSVFEKWMRQKRYSKNTIKNYCHHLELFLATIIRKGLKMSQFRILEIIIFTILLKIILVLIPSS